MPSYLFTSDLRITELEERIKKTAEDVLTGSNTGDKSAQNNSAT